MIDYINADGFVTVEKNAKAVPGEGNGWLQTGLAYACFPGEYLDAFDDRDGDPLNVMRDLFRRCRVSVENPMLYRSPYKQNADDNQNHDDYWGALLLARAFHPSWAEQFLDWGETHGWVYDIQKPDSGDVRFNFSRFPDFVPYMRLCTGHSITLTETIVLAGSIVWDALISSSKADANMRAFCKIHVARDKSKLCALAARLWVARVKQRYGTVGKSWADYFGPAHPLNQYDE